MTILITGAAGFIGFSVASRLLADGEKIIGIDNINNYYDIKLKKNRLQQLQKENHFHFYLLDITNRSALEKLFSENKIDFVIHLAAQPGVRYSITHPEAYINSNLVGFANMLEACRQHNIKHFIFASSSSVYGANTKQPFSETDATEQPVSLYSATKKANELMAHSYAHLYQLPCTGLRFFTVYGPWGRPDMALFSFTRSILDEKPITVFNSGNMMRDFTYIDDVVEAVIRIINVIPNNKPPYEIYNIGNHQPVLLKYFIEVLEKNLKVKAKLDMQPMLSADMLDTYADVTKFEKKFGALPHTSIETGIAKFVDWYEKYYHVETTDLLHNLE